MVMEKNRNQHERSVMKNQEGFVSQRGTGNNHIYITITNSNINTDLPLLLPDIHAIGIFY